MGHPPEHNYSGLEVWLFTLLIAAGRSPQDAKSLGAGTLRKWARYKLGDIFDSGAHSVDSCDVGGYDYGGIRDVLPPKPVANTKRANVTCQKKDSNDSHGKDPIEALLV